jgi:hypothetical protein
MLFKIFGFRSHTMTAFLRSHSLYVEFEPLLIEKTKIQFQHTTRKGLSNVVPFVCPDAPHHFGHITQEDGVELGEICGVE